MAYTVEDIQKVLGTTDNYYTPKEHPELDSEKKRYSVEDIEAVVGKSVPASTSAVSSSVNAKKSAAGRKTSAINKRKAYPREAEEQLERFSRLRKVDGLEGTNAPIASDLLPLMNSEKKRDDAIKKDNRVISKAAKNMVTKAFEGPKTFEEAKQNKNSQKSIANKPYSNVSEHVPSLEELIADADSMKSLVAPKTKGQPKKKQASTYLSGDMQPYRGVPAAANKQADSSVPKRQTLKEFDAAQMETYMNPEYRMDAREKSGAKKYIEDYYKTAKGFAGGPFKALENAQYRANWSDDEQRQYEQIVALENKLKGGAAFTA